ncbi:MAG: hypothetical protein ACE5IM_14515, partial [Nitrospinota bacterium]
EKGASRVVSVELHQPGRRRANGAQAGTPAEGETPPDAAAAAGTGPAESPADRWADVEPIEDAQEDDAPDAPEVLRTGRPTNGKAAHDPEPDASEGVPAESALPT